MFRLQTREPVILAEEFNTLVAWYMEILDFDESFRSEDEYNYCILENENGITIGFADSSQMGVSPGDRKNNTVVLQFQVNDV